MQLPDRIFYCIIVLFERMQLCDLHGISQSEPASARARVRRDGGRTEYIQA